MTTKTKPPRLYPGPAFEDPNSPTGWSEEMYDLNIPAEWNAWDAAWAARMGTTPDPISETPEAKRSGQGTEKSPAEKAAYAEAVAYIRDYRGNWGLILDLRADRSWGTKWFRLSDRQVEVILNAKKRDAEFAAKRATEISAEQKALVEQTLKALAENPANRPEFIVSIAGQGLTRPLSEKQTACLVRFVGAKATASSPARTEVTEGWYMVGETPWKAQIAVNGSGNLYGKRLDVVDGKGSWTYVPGGLKVIASQGRRMSLDEAKAFGALYGCCAVCGRTLTDETSIAAGIGPVCAGRLG